MSKSRLPYDDYGRFVPLACRNPDCGYGKLTLEDSDRGFWECDGLMDPNDQSKELEVCTYSHFDGDPWPQPFGRRNKSARPAWMPLPDLYTRERERNK